MDNALAEGLHTRNTWLLPGVNYIVIKEFVDDDGALHPVGERWKYLGCEYRKLAHGYVIFVSSHLDEEASFRLHHRRLPSNTPTVLDKLEEHVAGPNVDTLRLLNRLSPKVSEAFRRIRHWIEPVPDKSNDLIRAIIHAQGNASIADDRGGGGYEQVIIDLHSILEEVFFLLRDETPNEQG